MSLRGRDTRGGAGRERESGADEQRVSLVADQGLTSEAVAAALIDLGYDVRSLTVRRWPDRVAELRQQLIDFEPGVVLFLHEVPDPVHVRDMRRLMARFADVLWVLLTASPEGPVWGAGIDAGAVAVLPMDSTLQELTVSLSLVFRGESVMRSADRERVHRAWTQRPSEAIELWDRLDKLTHREAEVLSDLHRGHSVTEIALRAGVQPSTVRSQVKALRRKLNVPSQLSAVALFQQAVDTLVPEHRH